MNKEIQNLELFKEVQAEKFYLKKKECLRNYVELGRILNETKDLLQHGEFISWLEDERVNFSYPTANRYMKIDKELGDKILNGDFNIDNLSLRKAFELASAPEEVREEIINNSESKEEIENKIKQLQEEKKKRKNPTKAQIMAISSRSKCCCEICSQSFDGMENILQIHHIDGDRGNTIEENLILLCPNCHSIVHNCNNIEIIKNEELKKLWFKIRKRK